jgi:hypothetical protein
LHTHKTLVYPPSASPVLTHIYFLIISEKYGVFGYPIIFKPLSLFSPSPSFSRSLYFVRRNKEIEETKENKIKM